ncbi:uncharacterized protein LOC131687973 [Topomyia yanbarensis]|uniref:uncharacterized protein LOC131687973 n=1 Tax=Topomyia yanbarensis TaxID=2498891 RepID=UPI00273AADB7|nr:uncharacterized protein LOC131687973 [Topomyia yanbarensis]
MIQVDVWASEGPHINDIGEMPSIYQYVVYLGKTHNAHICIRGTLLITRPNGGGYTAVSSASKHCQPVTDACPPYHQNLIFEQPLLRLDPDLHELLNALATGTAAAGAAAAESRWINSDPETRELHRPRTAVRVECCSLLKSGLIEIFRPCWGSVFWTAITTTTTTMKRMMMMMMMTTTTATTTTTTKTARAGRPTSSSLVGMGKVSAVSADLLANECKRPS